MIRFLLRRIPRFGFVTLFAAMLLFVSVAGWAKWNLEFYEEEEALLADLAKAGVRYTCIRYSGDFVDGAALSQTPPDGGIWSAFAPYFSRIKTVALIHPTPHPLLDRAARLPFVEHVRGNWASGGSIPLESTSSIAGFDIPSLAAPELPTSLEQLPRGLRVEGDEATQAVERFVGAWRRPETDPIVGSSLTVMMPGLMRQFRCKDEDRHFHLGDWFFVLGSRESSDCFGYHAGKVLQENRSLGEAVHFDREDFPLILFDARRSLSANLIAYDIHAAFEESLGSPAGIRVEQIDNDRIRLELPPLRVRFDAADCEDAYAISLVARMDLDWRLEAWDATGLRSEGAATPANLPLPANSSFRGTLCSEHGHIVAESWTCDDISRTAPPTPGMPPTLVPWRSAGVARYDFSPDLDLSHVTPELFEAKMLPPQRKLPWLRWHRATFAISLCLFAWVGTRKLFARRVPADVQAT